MHQDPIHENKKKWKEELTPEQYHVLREKGTESAFTGTYYKTHEKGMYVCAGCGEPLFSSENKYDSGSGWPSFDRPVGENHIEMQTDKSHGMERTEVLCKKCGGHLGHLFSDGPTQTTGERFCINSCALTLKKEEKEDL